MWGCLAHWRMIPKHLQAKIWGTYVPGQEIRKDPTGAYIKAATEVRWWCLRRGGARPQTKHDAEISVMPEPFDFEAVYHKCD